MRSPVTDNWNGTYGMHRTGISKFGAAVPIRSVPQNNISLTALLFVNKPNVS